MIAYKHDTCKAMQQHACVMGLPHAVPTRIAEPYVQEHTRSAQVWAPMHWFDIQKVPEQWREGQYPKDILRYNRLTSAAARAANLTVFDTYNMTKGGATLDGVHVPVPVSVSKLQLLLSMLDAQQGAAKPVMPG